MENLNQTLMSIIIPKKVNIYDVFDNIELIFNEYMFKLGSSYRVHWVEERYEGTAIFYVQLDFSNDPYAPSNNISLNPKNEQTFGPNKEFFVELLNSIYAAFDNYKIEYRNMKYKTSFSTLKIL
jgi:hypothetical protein